MRANSTLQHLYLGANGITVVGARKLAQVTPKSTAFLAQFVPSGRGSGIDFVAEHVDNIGDRWSVTTLAAGQVIKEGECNLSGLLLASNRLGDEGVRVLCEALEQVPTFQRQSNRNPEP
eukprot:2649985-Rhodomonas_salina.2